jgi:hypothetical protein
MSSQWLTVDEVKAFCKERGLPMVLELYRGPFSHSLAKEYSMGQSCMPNATETREGIVIRDPKETTSYMGKKWVKLISELYLDDKDNTDNH